MTATVAAADPAIAIRERLEDLLAHIHEGRILEAIDRFYAEDVVMQENGNEPTRGRAANRIREQQFLDQVKQWNRFDVKARAVSALDDRTAVAFVESAADFVTTDDTHVVMEQVAVQRWRDGRIVHERFYYDSAA